MLFVIGYNYANISKRIKKYESLSNKYRNKAWDLRCKQGNHISITWNPYTDNKYYCSHCGVELSPPHVTFVID